MDNIIDTSVMEARLGSIQPIDTSTMESRLNETNSAPTDNSQPDYPYRSGDPTWDNFVENATMMAKVNNFPASVLLGQAALETGRGTSAISKEKKNFFGMNAVDSNPNLAYKYDKPTSSVQGYIDMITKSPRYSWAYQQYLKDKDPVKLISNIKASGYATDPKYVQKVLALPEFKHFSDQGN